MQRKVPAAAAQLMTASSSRILASGITQTNQAEAAEKVSTALVQTTPIHSTKRHIDILDTCHAAKAACLHALQEALA
ncbi:MAG: hypothetical protein HYT72_03625 [Candidatus Aenigmarchaeota archaeon]|nr:hypothetical protein [Candidatus Aenigmarchaeota archaeon]